MNLDELKSAWHADPIQGVHIPTHIKHLRQAQHPLDKLKRNMKNEGYMQITAVIFMAIAPQLFSVHPSTYTLYYTSYTMVLIISIYYLNTFRRFYQRVSHYTTDTKENLNEIYYEFKLNIERYHSFGFLLIPFVLVWTIIYSYSRMLEQGEDLSTIPDSAKQSLLITLLIASSLVTIGIIAWTRYFYSPYTKQIKLVLDELKKEEL
ncbi:hypothetical protein [Sphingobacterium faecale]|uniref:Uncharacterized protein n=1 Tax=Sphingobacterium faecale TaxID=2803775 RepID=A0ABS1R5E2_9SPHI|nr:hypothetical protein [Sphingobacterium faecale]MBL1409510.1 hypothetical protein [Sphingobacterium faecale]